MGRTMDPEKHRFWRAQLRAWQNSGLTQAEFCRRQGLRAKQFRSWKGRLGGERQAVGVPVRFITDFRGGGLSNAQSRPPRPTCPSSRRFPWGHTSFGCLRCYLV